MKRKAISVKSLYAIRYRKRQVQNNAGLSGAPVKAVMSLFDPGSTIINLCEQKSSTSTKQLLPFLKPSLSFCPLSCRILTLLLLIPL